MDLKMSKNRIGLCYIGLCLILSATLIKPANAAYQFDKVRLTLSFNQPIDTIRLTNPGKEQVINLQIRTVKWTQSNGVDNYEQTKDIIVAPPIMNIAPGKTQITRVGWRTPQPITQELAYRMIIQDLTPYKKQENVIQFKLQANMPIFIKPNNPIVQAQWRVQRAGNTLKVTNTNTGNVHIQVSKLVLTNANEEVVATLQEGYYLLPQQTKVSNLTITKSPGATVTINAGTDNGKLTSNVPVS
jgi:fimbrial chaperone protein